MSEAICNRIKAHRRVHAGDLVPHEFNFRLHGDVQRDPLQALYREVGFARSLLAYELPDGRLKLIDGNLRRDLDPDMEVEVEVLDVNDDEARALLLSIDPLAELAQVQEQLRDRLMEVAPPVPPELEAAWQAAASAVLAEKPDKPRLGDTELPEQYYVLITCRDEKHQVELLGRFLGEGLACKAVLG
jgi:hypothetical protein